MQALPSTLHHDYVRRQAYFTAHGRVPCNHLLSLPVRQRVLSIGVKAIFMTASLFALFHLA